jgi:hypothetical protein
MLVTSVIWPTLFELARNKKSAEPTPTPLSLNQSISMDFPFFCFIVSGQSLGCALRPATPLINEIHLYSDPFVVVQSM